MCQSRQDVLFWSKVISTGQQCHRMRPRPQVADPRTWFVWTLLLAPSLRCILILIKLMEPKWWTQPNAGSPIYHEKYKCQESQKTHSFKQWIPPSDVLHRSFRLSLSNRNLISTFTFLLAPPYGLQEWQQWGSRNNGEEGAKEAVSTELNAKCRIRSGLIKRNGAVNRF